MADMYAVNGSTLTDIADAIRLKSGDDTPMSVDDMALRIGLIEGSVSIIRGEVEVPSNSMYVVIPQDFVDENSVFMLIARLKDVNAETYTIDGFIASSLFWKFGDEYIIGNANTAANVSNAIYVVAETRTTYGTYANAFCNNVGVSNPLVVANGIIKLPARTGSYRAMPGTWVYTIAKIC